MITCLIFGPVDGPFTAVFSLLLKILSAPTSQAYVERVFSLCALLTAEGRNRMNKALEMRAFLKLNGHVKYGRMMIDIIGQSYTVQY